MRLDILNAVEQILTGIKSALGFNTDIGANVQYAGGGLAAEYSADTLIYLDGKDTIEANPNSWNHNLALTIGIIGYGKGRATKEYSANAIQDVYTAFSQAINLNTVAVSIEPSESEVDILSSGSGSGQAVLVAVVSFQVQYTSDPWIH
ncbi:hypothetical protein [Gloeobacter kilaueensis]|uniref:Uncharacterized protein n=1 Tax=Gloeobacter kilaueensis (strain ATCC BAA-2537 / CCAP 1431/1 / ULC 316 / JS1) TaxID=1183438 RepID=U5QDZ9_GLOK1|nr:hypothetical protein [Gloeobacter kilaueensis]AGY57146.1 hypothetical protein GKIL_0900 [Gloeobacter kilaueensis JS1]